MQVDVRDVYQYLSIKVLAAFQWLHNSSSLKAHYVAKVTHDFHTPPMVASGS